MVQVRTMEIFLTRVAKRIYLYETSHAIAFVDWRAVTKVLGKYSMKALVFSMKLNGQSHKIPTPFIYERKEQSEMFQELSNDPMANTPPAPSHPHLLLTTINSG